MTDSDFDNICDRFDASWREGKPLRIEDLLTASIEASRDDLLRALLEIELEYRIRAGEAPTVEDYAARFPQQQSLLAEALAAAKRRIETSTHDVASTSVPAKGAGLEESGATRRVIGPYKLLQQIGEGGMGTVYMAEQTKPVRRRVALKVVKFGLDRKEILSRFEAERQALAMMDHPNIAKVLDAGSTDDGLPFFVMELVNGIPITEFCDKYKLSLNDRLQLFVQACRAIQHAHQKGIIHRDVKPSNVLVTQHDGAPVAKVIDFGLAKALQNSQRLTDKTMFTEFGQVVGTLQYMSPEQSEMNALDIDTRSDVYSLGVLLYELLTGTTPIEKEALKRMALDRALVAIREEEAPRPSLRLSSLGDSASTISLRRKTDPKRLGLLLKGDLDWIAVKALEKDRNRRYESAHDLADDVSRFLANEPVEARSPSFAYRLQKLVAKHRRAAGITFALFALQLVALTGSAGFFWWQSKESMQQVKISEGKLVDTEARLLIAEQKRDEAEAATDAALNELKKTRDKIRIAEKDFQRLDDEVEVSLSRFKAAEENFKKANLTADAVKKANKERAVALKQLEDSIGRREEALNMLRKASYRDKIRLAANALSRNDFETYFEALQSCPEELRGWEHDYLYSLAVSDRKLIKDVNCYAVNDKYLVVGSKKSTIDIYDIESGKQIQKFEVESPVESLSISRSSEVFLAGIPIKKGETKTQFIAYSVSKGAYGKPFTTYGDLSPDGQQIVFLDRSKRFEVASISDPAKSLVVAEAKFSDGFWYGPWYLALERVGDEQPRPIYFWNRLKGGDLVKSDDTLPSGDWQLWRSRGNLIVRTAYNSFDLFHFSEETAELEELRKVDLPSEAISELCHSTDGIRFTVSPQLNRLALYSSCEPRIKIYDVGPKSTGELISVIDTDLGTTYVDWCADSTEIVVRDTQGRLKIHDLNERQLTNAFAYPYFESWEGVPRFKLVGNKRQYLVLDSAEHAGSVEIRSIEKATRTLHKSATPISMKSIKDGVYTVNISGEIHFVSTDSNTDAPPEKVLQMLRNDANRVWAAEWLSDRHVAVLQGGAVGIWDVQTKSRLMELASIGVGFELAWCPARRRLAASSSTHVFIWDFPQSGVSKQMHPTQILELPSECKFPSYLEFSPDGQHLCASSITWNLSVDDAPEPRRISSTTPDSHVTDAAFTIDGKYLVVGLSNGVIRKLHFPSLEPEITISEFNSSDAIRFCLKINPAGNLLFASCMMSYWRAEAKILDLVDGSVRLSFDDLHGIRSPFLSGIVEACFTDDGSRIILGETRGEIRVLDASNKMRHEQSVPANARSESTSTELNSNCKNLIDLETPPPAEEFVIPGTSEGSDAPEPFVPPDPRVPDPAPASDQAISVEVAPPAPANAGVRNP